MRLAGDFLAIGFDREMSEDASLASVSPMKTIRISAAASSPISFANSAKASGSKLSRRSLSANQVGPGDGADQRERDGDKRSKRACGGFMILRRRSW
jgi:hypothetical protein